MPDLPPLLHSLIDSPKPPAENRHDFKKTLALLNLHSVFDIIRLSRSEYIEQVRQHCDDDAGLAYDNACGYASQLEFLYREQALASDENVRRKRQTQGDDPASDAHTGPTYAALFNEDWNTFCETSSITAVDSPAAYLRDLYLFAQQVEKTGTDSKRIPLSTRRPELKDLVIDSESLTRQEWPMTSALSTPRLASNAWVLADNC